LMARFPAHPLDEAEVLAGSPPSYV